MTNITIKYATTAPATMVNIEKGILFVIEMIAILAYGAFPA